MHKRNILIVDDSEINRNLLKEMLCSHYGILEAPNAMDALGIIKERETEIALILLDIVMPVMDGFELLDCMHENGSINRVPVIMISSENALAFVDRAYNHGVKDYINRPFDKRTVLHRVNSTIAMTEKQNELANMVATEIYEKERDSRQMIDILANIVEFRNGESGLHVVHIRTLTELILRRLIEKTDRYNISKADIPMICNASALHDIGKITTPESILNKPGRLTPDEYEIMKRHAIEGAKLLSPTPPDDTAEPLIRTAYKICRYHHERYDGRGYPDGLRGEEIPIEAQVVALADVYDALTSKRVYKEAYSHSRAIDMIEKGECGAFNPLLLDCLTDVADELQKSLREEKERDLDEQEIINIAEDIKGRKGLDFTAQVIRQLEHEQKKNRFYADISDDIQFDYSLFPEMLMLSSHSADYLGLPQTIVNPSRNENCKQILSKDQMSKILYKLCHSTPKDPIVEQQCEIVVDGNKHNCKVIAEALWSDSDTPAFEGAIGKLLDVETGNNLWHEQ